MNFQLHTFLSPVTSSLLHSNTLISTPFLNTIGLHSSLQVSDQVAYQHTTGKIAALHVSGLMFLDGRQEDKTF